MPTTSRGYRFPSGGEPFDTALDIGELASDIDADVGQLAEAIARYYDAGAGTLTNLTTSATAPPGGASLSLPAGTYDVDITARFPLDPNSVGRVVTLHLYVGGTSVFNSGFTSETTGLASRNHSDFTRITLATASTVSLRAATSATGGTVQISANAIRAVKVA